MDAGIKFKGFISVQLDATSLEAILTIDKSGTENWDSAKLWKFLSSQGIKEGYQKKDLELQIFQFFDSREQKKSFVFARGTPPTPPTPEEVEWAEFTIPPELKQVSERLIKKYPNPAVFKIKTEKVQVEKTLEPEKKGLFGQKKPETKIETETRQVREHVVVNPKILDLGYFEAGAIIGNIFPGKPGKPGRDLQGLSIPPPPLPKSEFFLSEDIEKTRSNYIAKVSGFVRRGQNWLDLIPYQAHHFEIIYTEDKTGAFLNFVPGSLDAPHISVDDIYEKLREDGFDIEKAISKAKVDNLIRNALSTNKPIINQPLTEDSDASYRIQISTDKLKATLTVVKQLGKGKPLDLEALTQELKNLKIKSLNVEDVIKQVKEFLKSNAFSLDNLVIAQGRPPGREGNRILDYKVAFLDEEVWKKIYLRITSNPKFMEKIPGIKEFPLENVKGVATVQQNSTVAKLVPAEGQRGIPGQDLFGEPIPPYPGNDPLMKFWGNIRRAGDEVIAFEDGLVQVAKEDDVYTLRLIPYQDAKVEVFHSPDHMMAKINLYQCKGLGEPLTTMMVLEALKENQVLECIDQDAIAKALEEARKTGKAESVVVAKGRLPGSHLESRIQFLIATKKQPNGHVVCAVNANQEFALYKPTGQQCDDGLDILGNVIPCSQDEIQDLKLGQYIVTKPCPDSDMLSLVAEKSGEVIFNGTKIELKDKLILHGGAKKTKGVYKFTGDILVEGDVESGVAIYSGGDIKVSGDVGSSLLSGNNVIVGGKVSGDGKSVLSSKKHISVNIVEKTNLLSVGDTIIQQSALNCIFKCNSRVVQKKKEGTIAGGKIKSKFGLDVYNLGHPSKKETVISFGQDYLVEDQIIVEEKEIEKIRQAIVTMDRLMLKYSSPAYRRELDAVRKKKVVLMKLLEKHGRKLIFLRDKFEAHFPSEVVIRGTLFPGVLIESHGRVFEATDKKEAIRITFNVMSGKIEEAPL